MSLEASEVAVRVRLLGGTAFETEAKGVADSVEGIGAAGKRSDLSSFGASADKSRSKLETLSDRVGKFGGTMMNLSRSLAPASAAIAGLGYYAVKAQAQFQQSMMLLVTQAGLPRKHLQALTQDVLKLGSAVGQTPDTLAKGLFYIISSGIHNTRKAMADLKTAGVMAAVGGDTVDATANALTSIQNTGFKGSPNQIASYIEAAIGAGKMHMSDITAAMSTSILPMVKTSGMTLPQILASAAALTRQGVPAESAMSRMRLSLTSVMSPTKEGIGAMQQMGLAPFALSNDLHTSGGLLTMLQDLKNHTAGMSRQNRNNDIAEIFGKSRGIGNISALLQSLPQMQKIYASVMHASPKLLQQHFDETKTTSAFKMAQLKAEFDAAMIKLGATIQKYLLPVLVKLIPMLSAVVKWFGQLSPPVKEFILMFGAVLVVLTPILWIFGKLLMVVQFVIDAIEFVAPLFTALGEIVVAATGIAAGFVAAIALVVVAVGVVIYIFRNQLWAAIKAVANFLVGQFWYAVHKVESIALTVWGALKLLAKGIMDAVQWLAKLPGIIAHFVGHLASSVGGGLLHTVGQFFGSIIPGLASGGFVTSPGLTLVGERGPELLTLPRGASVTPLSGDGMANLRTSFDGGNAINMTTNLILDSKVLATAVANVNRKQLNRK